MKSHILRSLVAFAALALVPFGTAAAHGEPLIAVEPVMVSAGGQITVTGSEMEPGEVFAVSLEGPAGSILLGEATVTGDGEEGGFTATFTIPAETPPGSYAVRAAADEGEATTADLTVTPSAAEASAGPAMAKEPTGEPHILERTKSVGQILAVVAGIALSGAAGLVLVRSRS